MKARLFRISEVSRLTRRFVVSCSVLLFACTIQGQSERFLEAEELWSKKKYAAAVAEFDWVVKEDPSGSLGLQALYRASMTRTLFLGEHERALNGLKLVIERAPSSDLAQSSRREVAEILSNKMNRCGAAVDWIVSMLSDQAWSNEVEAELRLKIARCQNRLGRLKEASETYTALLARPLTPALALRAKLELGYVLLGRANEDVKAIEEALTIFQAVATAGKGLPIETEATFGIANAFEEKGKLVEALEVYESLRKTFDPTVVLLTRIARVEQRIKRKAGEQKR
jgi:tetratricopeptide (TPR) repeat protein